MGKIKDLFQKHESRIVLIIGFLLVSIIAFETGYLKGQERQDGPIIIEKPIESPKIEPESLLTQESINNGNNNILSQNSDNIDKAEKNCIFIGSKNSNKYHLPSCRWAKNIKPENKVCFSSPEDAINRGYQPDKNCIK